MQLVHKPSVSNQTESESTLSADFSLEDRRGSNKLADTDMDSPGTGDVSIQNAESEERYTCGSTISSHEDCSTSGIYRHKASKFLQRNKSRRIGERNKRKRWRGRHEVQVNANMSEEQQVLMASMLYDLGYLSLFCVRWI